MTSALNFDHIGLLYNPKLSASRVMAAEMLEFIEGFGAAAWVTDSWNDEVIGQKIAATDLLITLGGDGTTLKIARIALGQPAVILGVNQGRLGFLSEVQPAEWPQRFEQMLTGSYWIEARMMIQAEWFREGKRIGSCPALNEVAVSRGGMARVVRLETYINDGYLTTYTADGMILSTPTGSTAYALAAGGPILPPELKNILLIPVAPHLSLERAIVLSEGDQVRLQIQTDHKAILTADGQFDVIWTSDGPQRPAPFPGTRSRLEWEGFLDRLSRSWEDRWENPGG